MRPELETYHQIDSYLNGQLEGEALRSFEEKLQSDPAFAEEVSFQQLTNEVVIGASYDDLRSQMTKDIKSIDSADKTKKWSLYAVATFVLFTGAAGLYYYYSNQQSDVQEPATKQIETIQAPISSQASGTSPIASDSKEIPVHKESSSGHTAIKEPVSAKADTQTTVVPASPIQQHPIPAGKTTPDVKIAPPVEQKIHTNPCLHVQLAANITASPSCVNDRTGSILVHAITGGTKPYYVSIDELTGSSKTKESYSYLKADTYTVRITDANGCVKTLQTVVPEKVCRKNVYVFAPEKGETWKISGSNSEDFIITIINIAGTQVYKSNLIQGEFEWQGIGQQGEYLTAGLYIYVIEYTNGQKENGQVTIVR